MRTSTVRARRLLLWIALVMAAATALAACGGDDDPAATDSPDDAPGTEAEDPGAAEETDGTEEDTDDADAGEDTDETDEETVEVTLVDYAFEGLPDTVPAGTRFTIENDSESELHELVAARLPDDEDRSVAELAGLPTSELVAALGGEPTTVLLAEPGGPEIAAVGDGTLSEPGRYAVMCFIPTGADPQEYLEAAAESGDEPPQVQGGPPHFVNGMYDEVTVD